MKLDDFMDALGQVEDRYVISAGKRATKRKRRWGIRAAAAAAVLAAVIGVAALASPRNGGGAPESGFDSALTGGAPEDNANSMEGTVEAPAFPESDSETPADAPTLQPPADAPFMGSDALPNAEPGDPSGDSSSDEFVTLSSAQQLAAPFYPSRVARTEDTYAQWLTEQDRLALPEGIADVYRPYLTKALPVLLGGLDGENRITAPMNLYLAMSMLAETAGGNSRQQILDLLGQDDLDVIRSQAMQMWNALYMADGASRLDLASSLWLRSGMTYSQSVLQSLASHYFASSYSGNPGTPAYDAAMQEWIRDHTGGLLEEEANALTMDPDTVLALVSTVSYQDTWFWDPEATTEGLFHTPDGDVPAMMMHSKLAEAPFWQTDRFTAVQVELANSQMLLILPNEGISPEDLLEDPEAIALLSGQPLAGSQVATVSLTLPRFDVSASGDLKEALQSLRITDVFDPDTANFDPLDVRYPDGTESTIAVNRVEQAVRVSIDESGCQGAGYVYVEIKGYTGVPEEQEPVEITVDRPFLFAVLKDQLPVFTGIVNHP